MKANLQDVIFNLYHSEINASISWFWDGGWDVKLGDELNGWRAEASFLPQDFPAIADWLDEQAKQHFPRSLYALEGEFT